MSHPEQKFRSNIAGLRIWNYNASPEATYCGVRTMNILLDGQSLLNPFTKDNMFFLRRAPGNLHYDYVQDIRFTEDHKHDEEERNSRPLNIFKDYICECLSIPEGFVFQIVIFSTWGDPYYCGLNGIELYDEYEKKVMLEEQRSNLHSASIISF